MTMVLPKEHGAWAMLVVPFVVGLALGKPSWLHLPLFWGLLFLYLCSHPLLMLVRNRSNIDNYRKWLIIYGFLAIAALTWPIVYYPQLLFTGIMMVPFLLVNIYFASIRQERHILNDLSAIAGLSLGAVASGYLASGVWADDLLLVWLLCIVFFMGSVFFVKSMIREKGNRNFLYLSWVYHILVLLLSFGLTGSWLIAAAYLPSMSRTIIFTGRPMTTLAIGKLEILNSVVFTVCLASYFKLLP